MVIKSAELETIAGKYIPGDCFCGQIKCWKVFADQRIIEPEIAGEDFGIARKDTDDQLLQYQQESVFC